MYQPPAFREQRAETLHALMRGHPLATLVISGAAGIEANHMPLLLHEEDSGTARLSGHMAKANPLARALLETAGGTLPALAIFHGPEHYISPGWYPSKAAEGKAVPTWNFAVVHAHGVLRAMADEASLRAHLDALSAAHEAGRTPPWSPADAPADFIAAQIKGITGFDIEISRLEGKFKLGQNRSAEDRAGIVRGLEGEDDAEAARLAAMTPVEKP
ncbi:MAG: FMN-binding negative transcriptional regulator [Alphaproteobacteria bacterium]|jgi:transcriptional regulator|nr:FMN-binding negative transcriptional regulator [Alphaproteobacteria bacterium]MDP6819760.1 FMN-binding negative transcriptional regulator [Alphaproteobacteria bacterium]